MFTSNPYWLLLLIESGWELSPLYAILLICLTISSVVRLAAYALDRRKHFYPFLAASLVAALVFSSWEVVLYAFGHMPAHLHVGLSTTPVNTSIFLSFLVLIIVTIVKRSLPLTKSQKRKLGISVITRSGKLVDKRI